MTIDLERVCRDAGLREEVQPTNPPRRMSFARFIDGKFVYAIEPDVLDRLVNAVLEEAAKAAENTNARPPYDDELPSIEAAAAIRALRLP